MFAFIVLAFIAVGLVVNHAIESKRGVFTPFTLVKGDFNPASQTTVWDTPTVNDLISVLMDSDYPMSIKSAIKAQVRGN